MIGQRLLAAFELVLLDVELELDVRLALRDRLLSLLELLFEPAQLVCALGQGLLLRGEPPPATLDVCRVGLDRVGAVDLGLAFGECTLALVEAVRSAGERGAGVLELLLASRERAFALVKGPPACVERSRGGGELASLTL